MASGLWDELSGGIVNLLNTLTTVDPTIAIFDYGRTNIPAYPTIQVTPNGGPALFADTSRSQRSYIFNVDCYIERTKFGEQKSEQVARQLVDSIIALFDANIALDQVNGQGRLIGRGFCKAIPSAWSYVTNAEQTNLRKATVLLECVVIQ